MATPMPAELDVSKILLLSLDAKDAAKIEALNVEFVAKAGPAARPSSRRS
jgi:hypothetical protein